jgi:hypothetical protein
MVWPVTGAELVFWATTGSASMAKALARNEILRVGFMRLVSVVSFLTLVCCGHVG